MKFMFCVALLVLATVAFGQDSGTEDSQECLEYHDKLKPSMEHCKVEVHGTAALISQSSVAEVIRSKRFADRPLDPEKEKKMVEFVNCMEGEMKELDVYKKANESCVEAVESEKPQERIKCMHRNICEQCPNAKHCKEGEMGRKGPRPQH